MSLLMDALKKAEEEKRRVIEQTQERDGEALELSRSGERARREPVGATPAKAERTQTAPYVPTIDDTAELSRKFSLEPLTSQGEVAWSAAPTDTGATVPDLHEDTTGKRAATYDQESTLPSERSIKASLDEYFESSQSGEGMRMVVPPAGSDLPEVDERIGTSVSAETVFAASARSPTARVFNLIVGACIVLAGLFVAGGAYYLLQTPTPRQTPLPTVAVGVETPVKSDFVLPEIVPPESRLVDAAPTPQTPAGAMAETPIAQAPVEAPGPGTAPFEPTVAAADAGASAAAASPASVATEAPAAAGPPAAAQRPVVMRVAPPGGADRETPAPSQARPLAVSPAPQLTPAAMRISRSRKSTTGAGGPAMEAYQAYLAGDLERAAGLYEQILAQVPNDRDALLGRAAIALRLGQTEAAIGSYRRVLQLNPRDTVASAALFNLQGPGAALVEENRLKMLLHDSPDASHLHFALGNHYAREARWADAQQAYFDALRIDGANPDYAFNLAVSLDRLGQGQAAAGYYQQALELADAAPANFDSSSAINRIQSLSGGTGLP
jgi:Flp pilus assembly protein TadD